MRTLAEHFRHWYEHERDCNRKVFTMIESVPVAARSDPRFRQAVDLFAHMTFWRRAWLHSIGHLEPSPWTWTPEGTPIEELAVLVRATEAAWCAYLDTVTADELARPVSWHAGDGTLREWPVENILYQVGCHHWYHRGQIALLAGMLGGTPISTDYYFWNPPHPRVA